MKTYLKLYTCTLLTFLAALTACSDDDDTSTAGTVTVNVQHVVGSQPLQLETSSYTSPTGASYTVSSFKYYISNVKLLNSAGEATYLEKESYHLIDQAGKLSFDLKDVPADTYTQLQFAVGIDEELNHRIDYQGDLDASNEMVWDWNTGYKFISLVGNFTGSTRSGGLVFHVGGDANYRTITLNLPQALNLRQKSSYNVQLQANVNELFQNPNTIDFDQMSSAGHGTGPNLIADNYSNGFFQVISAE